jgi:hypothetical protein
MTLEVFRQIFQNCSTVKFNQNPSSGSRVFQCGARTDGQTDMKKLIVEFRNFANAPSVTLSITDLTWIGQGSSPGLQSVKHSNKHVDHDSSL